MKQSLIPMAVLLGAAGLWSFRNGDHTPAQYLMVVRDMEVTGYSGQPRPALTVIEPDGTFKTEELPVISYNFPRERIQSTIVKGSTTDSTSTRLRRFRYAHNYLLQAEVRKLNELSTQGWVLINTMQEPGATRYLMRKD